MEPTKMKSDQKHIKAAYENWDMSGEGPIDLPWDLLDKQAVCRMFGGTRPINAATLYRGIKQGRYPKQVKVGGSSRWLRSECESALRSMVDGRVS
jgi:predicted DNA-binding transcriptional regulator AlpA